MQKSIDKILSTIDDAIFRFSDNLPKLQQIIFDELQPILKDLNTRNGNLLNDIGNLRAIGKIRNLLEKLIISNEYKANVKAFIATFNQINLLQNDYFRQFNIKFSPVKTLPILQELAIDSTVNGLLGQGMRDNLIKPLTNILTQNITTGGSYSKLTEELRKQIIATPENEGSLQKYTKQITVDALNQYSAQVHEAIAQDLKFNWGRYIGSNLTTTRQFCFLLTQKEWVHRSELPAITQGRISGIQCKLSPTTGLPVGMIPGTDADNFKVRRGGYNCGHQFFWVPDSVVPAVIRSRI